MVRFAKGSAYPCGYSCQRYSLRRIRLPGRQSCRWSGYCTRAWGSFPRGPVGSHTPQWPCPIPQNRWQRPRTARAAEPLPPWAPSPASIPGAASWGLPPGRIAYPGSGRACRPPPPGPCPAAAAVAPGSRHSRAGAWPGDAGCIIPPAAAAIPPGMHGDNTPPAPGPRDNSEQPCSWKIPTGYGPCAAPVGFPPP